MIDTAELYGGGTGSNEQLVGTAVEGFRDEMGRGFLTSEVKPAGEYPADGSSRSAQRIVTSTGSEAIPLATTSSVLSPAGVPFGTVKLVEDAVPGATDTELQPLVRA